MVIGFDVHHGTGRSYGALAATTSANLASYFSTVITLEQGNNMGGEIGAAMISPFSLMISIINAKFLARVRAFVPVRGVCLSFYKTFPIPS